MLCPLSGHCQAGQSGKAESFPVKPPKKPRPQRQGCAFWIERGGAVWLVKRVGKGMLGGMRALPDDGWTARADGGGPPPLAGEWHALGSVEHIFTHFALRLNLALYSGKDCDSLLVSDGEWWPLDRLDEAGLPTLFAKAARLAMATRGDGKR